MNQYQTNVIVNVILDSLHIIEGPFALMAVSDVDRGLVAETIKFQKENPHQPVIVIDTRMMGQKETGQFVEKNGGKLDSLIVYSMTDIKDIMARLNELDAIFSSSNHDKTLLVISDMNYMTRREGFPSEPGAAAKYLNDTFLGFISKLKEIQDKFPHVHVLAGRHSRIDRKTGLEWPRKPGSMTVTLDL